ncbi:MAG: saccharopine dehydrogenase NADP-binding domain-containing protein [Trueperaceae bacterium]
MTRDLDLVVHGASGYVGRLVARAVAERAPRDLRWALSGRDAGRLHAVHRELGLDARRVDVLVADAHDHTALATLAGRTRTVLTTVGPYARHGGPLVAACALAGTDLADLTGEALWMRDTIDAHHVTARRSGARIVHACGFDSVPSDLGVLALQRAALERHGRPCSEIVHLFGPLAGGVSGGTVASLFDLVDAGVRDPATRRKLADPDLLAPEGSRSAPSRVGVRPRRHDPPGVWSAPFLMAAMNEKVVRRTRALLGEPWGEAPRYLERLAAPTWARAAALGRGTALLPLALSAKPVRRLAARFLPRPGEGPSEQARERGFFRTTLIGRVPGVAEPIVGGTQADRDPGYGATAPMLAEMGLLLAAGESDAPGGVLTPAVAGGERLIQRLAQVGIRIEATDPATAPAGR